MNPFRYAELPGDEDFCNRWEELKFLTDSMMNGDKVIVFAERRMGKTSLVRRALESLDDGKALWTYVDLWPTFDERMMAESLARSFSRDLVTTDDGRLKALGEFFSRLRPTATVDEDGGIQFSFKVEVEEVAEPELQDVLSVPGKIAERSGRRVVVVLDEFQQIFEYETPLAERVLRHAMQFQPGVSFVLLGSRKHMIQRMVLDKNRPLYRSGGYFHLGSIEEKHWKPYIETRFQETGKPVDEETIHLVCELSEGHPYYTRSLCHMLWETWDEIRNLEPARRIEEILARVLKREASAYFALWESFTRNQRLFLYGLAVEAPPCKVHGGAFIREYGLKTNSNVQNAVQKLLERNIIDKEKGALFISDRFFREWIRREEYRF